MTDEPTNEEESGSEYDFLTPKSYKGLVQVSPEGWEIIGEGPICWTPETNLRAALEYIRNTYGKSDDE